MTPSVKKILNNGSRYKQIKDRNIAHCSSTFRSSTVSPIELSEIAVGFWYDILTVLPILRSSFEENFSLGG